MNGGPQATADIVISNGMQMLVDGTFHTAVEFCINDGGAELPPELFVFINAPMGDTTLSLTSSPPLILPAVAKA
jgi:hypothetical protein